MEETARKIETLHVFSHNLFYQRATEKNYEVAK